MKKANEHEMELRAGFAASARPIILLAGLAADSSHNNRVKKI